MTRANSAITQCMNISVISRICTVQKRGQFIEKVDESIITGKIVAIAVVV